MRNMLHPGYDPEEAELEARGAELKPPNEVVVKTKQTTPFSMESQPMNERLRTLLESPPTPEQYKPSLGRRIAGAVAGGLTGAARGGEVGSKIASSIVNSPYERAAEGYQAEVNPLLKLDEIERTRSKDAMSGLSEIASYMRARTGELESDPDYQANVAGKVTTAQENARLPGRREGYAHDEYLTNLRETGQDRRNVMNQAGANARNAANIEGQNVRNTADNEAANRRALLADARAREAEEGRNARAGADRASREKMNARTLAMRKEISDANRASKKPQRLSVDQQVKAREDAEFRILREASNDELTAIADPIRDTKGNIIGYALKPKANVKDPGWLRTWEIRRDDAAKEADRMLGEAFDPNQDEEEDDGMGDWEFVATEEMDEE